MRGWKDTQSRRKNTKKTGLALIVLASILALLLLSQVVKFTQMVFSPWKLNPSVRRTILWNGESDINIIIKAKDISLLSFSPQNQKVTIIDIPKETYLEASHMFGKWILSSIYDLGQSQNIGGGKLLKDTLVNFFAMPIDGFLQFSDEYSQKGSSAIVSDFRKNPFSLVNILPNLKTDLTPFELIRLKLGLSGVRFDKIKQINLGNTSSLQKMRLADGTEVLTVDTIRLDSILSNMNDPAIQREHKTVAIFNSTNHPGLAQKAARLITNIGGDVIITSNGQNQLKSTQIVGDKSETLDRLKQIFEASDIITGTNEDLVSSRAQINLFLGEDYFDRL